MLPFPVRAWGKDKAAVIEVTSLFTSDVSEISARRELNAGTLDTSRTYFEEIKAFPLLQGARGTPKADLNALAKTIMKVQRLAMDLSGEIAELDINPLVALPKGCVALDALIVTR